MQNYVFLIDQNKQPLNPVSPKRARKLLAQNKAAVFRRYPFTLIIKKVIDCPITRPLTIKLDPGSITTGIALLDEDKVIWVAELSHRGQQIKDDLESRARLRRGRRNRQTRYRQPRFNNRKRADGWLAPSLLHRVQTITTWVKKLMRYAPIDNCVMELVRFDTQRMQNGEISGIEYQQGELAGYEIREYLLEKWGRKCVYCNAVDTRLQVEHIVPHSKNGSNRISNLTLACAPCNQKKSNQDIRDFLVDKPALLSQIQKIAKQPLKDAAAVNSTRWKLYRTLKDILPIRTGTGGQTKWNRARFNLPKRHYIDAAATGNMDRLIFLTHQPLEIKATGWGNRQMCGTNKYGFPVRHRSNIKIHKGFQTGDIIKAVVNKGKKIGTYTGRVLVRKSGSFDIKTSHGRVAGISYKYCIHLHSQDGYQYSFS
ncbi:MAG: RNA-guided endonuclease IscB [Xenococcaceae cyanobacterium MO_207.B15]|nr:RNA-guided endonuclease IscB [Xenococcaceae cyanobacterium MO_207.B15]